MLSMPDVATLGLCSLLTSTAFFFVLLFIWLDRRAEDHWVYWAVSSGLYAATLAGFRMVDQAWAVALLYDALALSNLLILAGIRRFDGKPAWRAWMALPILAPGLAYLTPALAAGPGANLDWLSRIGGTAGLSACMVIVGGITVLGHGKAAMRGRRIVGFALLAYLPGYVLAMAADGSGGFDPKLAALLPMLSDQVLLAVLYLGLLSMSGERAQAALRDMALRDPLTGALNRAGLTELCLRGLAPDTGVILTDVDHFKAINDSSGHAAGDAVLVDLVIQAKSLLPGRADVIARLGGDEFVVLLHDTTLAETRKVADRLCRAAGRTPGLPDWTVSLGVAMGMGGLAETLARADRALYAAKASGRARAVA